MNHLEVIAIKIAQLHSSLALRPTLERACEIGELLDQAREQLSYGKWGPWLRDHLPFLSQRSANIYVQVYRADGKLANSQSSAKYLSIDKFLRLLRDANAAAKQQERKDFRAALAAQDNGSVDDIIQLHNCDCRKFNWPDGIDAVCTDPPWGKMECYQWLAKMSASKLKPGGLLMVQCGTKDIGEVNHIFRQAKLSFFWQCAIIYQRATLSPGCLLSEIWRPVLLFSRGKLNRKGLHSVPDGVMTSYVQDYHDWQSPLRPWTKWLSALTRPGELIADPFAGSGTIGLATREVSLGRRYIGCEVDEKCFRVARARLERNLA